MSPTAATGGTGSWETSEGEDQRVIEHTFASWLALGVTCHRYNRFLLREDPDSQVRLGERGGRLEVGA